MFLPHPFAALRQNRDNGKNDHFLGCLCRGGFLALSLGFSLTTLLLVVNG